MQKILNYLFEFKYSYYSVENIYHLLSSLKVSIFFNKKHLKEVPIYEIEKKLIEEEKFINLRVLDVFGKDNKNINADLTYKIYREDSLAEETSEYKLRLNNSTSTSSIDIKNIATSNGNYFLDIKSVAKNNVNNSTVTGNYKIKFSILHKVKITHVKLSLVNPVEKSDEKEMYF